MRRALAAAFALPALVLPGAAPAGIDVESRELIGTIRYRTFAFEEGTPARGEATQERLLAAVERELRARGLIRVFGETELRVKTHMLVDRHRLADLERQDYFEYWRGVRSVDPFDLRAGTIVIDLVDVSQKRTVWRGVASASVKGGRDRTLRTIDRMVEKLFKRFREP